MTRKIKKHCPICNASFLHPEETLPGCPQCAARSAQRETRNAGIRMYHQLVSPELEKTLDAELDDLHGDQT